MANVQPVKWVFLALIFFNFSLAQSLCAKEANDYFGEWGIDTVKIIGGNMLSEEIAKQRFKSHVKIGPDSVEIWFDDKILTPVRYKYTENALSTAKEGVISDLGLSSHYGLLVERKVIPTLEVIYENATYFHFEILSDSKMLFVYDRRAYFLTRKSK